MKKKKVCCITGTRADYPRVKSVLKLIKKNKNLDLQIIVTGSHLLKSHGFSYKEILNDGFKINKKVKMYDGDYDSPLGMTLATAKCTAGIADALDSLKPDVVLLTVDRVETLSAATAASLMNFPIFHIQGGEVTGTIDESIRHAVTKLSHFHFPATSDAKKRIIKMGEPTKYVKKVGCPYIDEINDLKPTSKKQLGRKYKLPFDKRFCIFTQHPVTTEYGEESYQILETLKALDDFNDFNVINLSSNPDAGGKKISRLLKDNKKFFFIPNMDSKDFLSLMKYASFMIGNSSAGIREAPSFGLPVINIGTRQNGRLRASNVLDVNHDSYEIKKAIQKVLNDKKFLLKMKNLKNPYGDGKAAKRIVNFIEKTKITKQFIQKRIVDVE